MKIWQFIFSKLVKDEPVALLCVLHSSGSSPGRQGFKMAVLANGEMSGSIGGGIMEHKLVELAKDKLKKGEDFHLIKRQIHRKDENSNQSGMICSGEQTIVISLLKKEQISIPKTILETISTKQYVRLKINQNTCYAAFEAQNEQFVFDYKNDNDWLYQEQINFFSPTVKIIGAGHVGLALSRQMKLLGFTVVMYDDRPDLNTFVENTYADYKVPVAYEKIGEHFSEQSQQYVVIMTFGYRSDEIVLRQLLDKNLAYLGMLGSQTKIDKMFTTLRADGFSDAQLNRVFAPIGVSISSKTPAEIAVSIAAQILRIKNR